MVADHVVGSAYTQHQAFDFLFVDVLLSGVGGAF